MKVKYIKTMDFTFENVTILNCHKACQLAEKIRDNEVVKIENDGKVEYINSSYIMYYELEG